MHDNIFSLKGRVALVTGASSGLGRHFAQVLADAGATVVVAARREDRLSDLVNDISNLDGDAMAVTMDVTDTHSVKAAYDKAYSKYGTVDVLVNNAGVGDPKYFVDLDEESWDFVMETNLKGAWRVAQECARRLVRSGTGGSIINIASILGLTTQLKQTSYSVSKAGVAHLTRMMALELIRYGIRVNALAPGYFPTEMNTKFFGTEAGKAYVKTIPARRLGRIAELTGPLLLLASEAGSFMNGAVLPVDGGHLVAGR